MSPVQVLLLLLAVTMVVAGALLTQQGLDAGSRASGGLYGPALAGLGVALVVSVVGAARRR